MIQSSDPQGRRLPIKLDTTSNGEFVPVPLSPANREANRLAHEAAERCHFGDAGNGFEVIAQVPILVAAQFVEAVVDRHPDSPKPAIIGNCQGGWATMMLAAPLMTHPMSSQALGL